MNSLQPKLRFDETYCETMEIEGGQEVVLRLVRPSDKGLLLEGLGRLSPQSRRFRFMGARNSFTQEELDYLCDVDGLDHFAMGAVVKGEDGSEEGVAIARFVRSKDRPEAAEPAVTIIDDYQSKGLGKILLKRLVAAARERGIRVFHSEFLRSNFKVAQLLDDYAESSVILEEGDVVTVEFPLPKPRLGERLSDALHRSEIYRAFVDIARGALPVRFGRSVNAPK